MWFIAATTRHGDVREFVNQPAVAYPGFQRGGCLSSGPIRKAGWGGGGCCRFLARYEKRGRGGGGGGGGGGVLLVWPNTSAYLECAGGGCRKACAREIFGNHAHS